jgi:KUP system potassium uptake protein
VSLTMFMTSALLFIAMREIWLWSLPAAAAIATVFLVIDGAFFVANMAKVLDGGYVPLILAMLVYGVMWIWHRGAVQVHDRVEESLMPIDKFVDMLKTSNIARVPGAAVFLTRAKSGTPPVMVWHVKHNRALHEYVMILTLTVMSTPRVDEKDRLVLTRVAPKLWRAEVRYGFIEHPDIQGVLAESKTLGCETDLDDITYYVGHETIVAREDGKGLPRWQEALFAVMGRNAARISDFLQLPTDQVVEIGRQISI